VWRAPIARRPLLLAAGAALGAAGLPAGSARAAGRDVVRAAAPAVDAISTGTWLAGDTHVHDDHSSDGSFIRQIVSQQGPGTLSVADQIGEGERTGLQWMPLTDHRTYDQHWDPQWTSSKLLLIPGEEANGAPHATCLGAVDVVVDGINPPGLPFRHIQQSIWDVHAQGGSWGIAHPSDPVKIENDCAIGAHTVETWNRATEADVEVDWAENAWNKGFRFGAAGACDCHFKELWGVAGPGMPTTWVLAKAQTERSVLDALRAGRTTLSSSPVGAFVTLEADADGDGIYEGVGGDELVATGSIVKLRVRVQRAPGMTLYVYEAPGRAAVPLLQKVITSADESYTVDAPMQAPAHWWRAEVRGDGPPSGMTTNPQADVPKSADQLQAMTSPVFATTGAPAVPQPAIALPPLSGDASGAVVDLGGGWHGFPDVAGSPAGAHVVAEEHGDGVTSVVYVDPSGRRTTIADGAARLPKVAVNGDDVWVAYQDEAGQLPRNPQVFLAHSTDGGHTFDTPQRLSDGRGRQERVALALLPDGRPVVAWQASTGSAVEVLVWWAGDAAPAVVSLPGKVITPPNAADSRSARYPASLFPDLAVLRDAVVVSWQDNRNDPDPLWTGHLDPQGIGSNDPTGVTPNDPGPKTDPDRWEPMVAVRPLDGSTWSAPIRVAPRDDRAQCHPAIGAAGDGTLVCAWDSRELRSSGTSPVIAAATSSDGGQTWAAAVEVDVTPPLKAGDPPMDFSQRPRLAADPDGALRMVWYDARGADWRWAVRSAVLVDGIWQRAGEVVRGGNCTWPAVDNGVVVATTDRASQSQRDPRQDIVLATVAEAPGANVPEVPLPVVLPVAAAVVGGLVARARRRTALDTATGARGR
jgi:hypothetical protein